MPTSPPSGAASETHREAPATPSAAAPTDANLPPSPGLDLRAPTNEPAPHPYRRSAYVPLAAGVAALAASGVLYAIARDRAQQFNQEQQTNGYGDRARNLHDEAQNLEIASWLSAGAGVVAAGVGGVLLTF